MLNLQLQALFKCSLSCPHCRLQLDPLVLEVRGWWHRIWPLHTFSPAPCPSRSCSSSMLGKEEEEGKGQVSLPLTCDHHHVTSQFTASASLGKRGSCPNALGGFFWTSHCPALLLSFQVHSSLCGDPAQCIFLLGVTCQAGYPFGWHTHKKVKPSSLPQCPVKHRENRESCHPSQAKGLVRKEVGKWSYFCHKEDT